MKLFNKMTTPKVKVEETNTKQVKISWEKEGSRYDASITIRREGDYVTIHDSNGGISCQGGDSGLSIPLVKELIKGLQTIVK